MTMIFLPIFNEAKGFCLGNVAAPNFIGEKRKSRFWMKCRSQLDHDIAGGVEEDKEVSFFFSCVELGPLRRGA